jgi:Domain of unknown function (DUF4350)
MSPLTASRRQIAGIGAVAVLLVLVVVLTVVVTGRGNGVPLDPDGSGPNGARALTHVLRDHGVQVQVERSSGQFAATIGADSSAVVVVSRTDLLSDQDVQLLHDDVTTAGRTLVLLFPSQHQLDVLTPGVRVQDATDHRRVAPGCGDTTAQRAGAADAGGQVYDVDSGQLSASAVTGALGCYLVHGDPSYLVVLGQGRTVLVGQPRVFTNQDLAKDGNAALAVGTLGGTGSVLWLVPSGGTAAGQESSLSSLLPRWVGWVVLQLFVVVGICMLWRGRRLGRLVTEPLPVVVRAVETTEGRARMYRRTRARARAAWTLRDATIQRLREQSGLPRSSTPSDVIAVFSGRVGIPTTDLTAMLLGPPPSDDAGLVRLAQILDQLDREVHHR